MILFRRNSINQEFKVLFTAQIAKQIFSSQYPISQIDIFENPKSLLIDFNTQYYKIPAACTQYPP